MLYISSFTPPIGFEWSPWCAFNSAFDEIRITIPGRWCHVYRADGYYDVYTAHCIVIHKVISEGSGRLNILYRQPQALSMQSHSGVPLPSSPLFCPDGRNMDKPAVYRRRVQISALYFTLPRLHCRWSSATLCGVLNASQRTRQIASAKLWRAQR